MAEGARTLSKTAVVPDLKRSNACIDVGAAMRAIGCVAVASTASTSPSHMRSGRSQCEAESPRGPSSFVQIQLPGL